MQEVDQKVFERFYEPHLRCSGYQGLYTNKVGKVSEGSATFFDSSRFRLVAQCAATALARCTRLRRVTACQVHVQAEKHSE